MPPKGGEQDPPKRPTGPPLGRLLGRGTPPLTPVAAPPVRPAAHGSPLWAVPTERSDWGQCSRACSALSIPAFGSYEI